MALYTLMYFVTNTRTGAKNAGLEATREFEDDRAAIEGFQKAMTEFRERAGRYYDTVTLNIFAGNRQVNV